MDKKFDLNIENYTLNELENIFELPLNYSNDNIETQGQLLKQNIISNNEISHETKKKTLEFIEKVKQKLLSNKMANANGSKMETSKFYNLDKNLKKSELDNDSNKIIIKPHDSPFTQAEYSQYYPGVINPTNKRIIKKNIGIDTRFRDNYYSTSSTNFQFELPIKLTNVNSLQLSALELPTTFYAITKLLKNNFFALEIPGEPRLLITVPDGNYEFIAFQQYLNDFLENVQTVSNKYKRIRFLIDITTNELTGGVGGTGKTIIGLRETSENEQEISQFSVNFMVNEYGEDDNTAPLPLRLGWLMGFRNGFYTGKDTYISEGLIDLLGTKYVYLVVNDFNNNVSDGFYGAFNSSILNKNILARISMRGTVFQFMSQNDFSLITTPRQYFGPVDIQKIEIQLLDEYGRILNLNNMDYSLCLTYDTTYDL